MQEAKIVNSQHNSAKKGGIAQTVLMPGDPGRAKYIAEKFLSKAVLVNDVRQMYAYTGTYKGRRVSVMAHGMGAPSMAIYAHELFSDYDVENIIRIGTAGALVSGIDLGAMIAVSGACYNTGYCHQFGLNGTFSAVASFPVLSNLVEIARSRGVQCYPGMVLSSDVYYQYDLKSDMRWAEFGVWAVEMETAALYIEAARTGKRAASLLTITGSLVTGEYMAAGRTNRVCDDMIAVALETAISLSPAESLPGGELHSWRVSAVMEYISKHLTDRITIETLCAITGTSRSHLSYIFKAETGFSIVDYINRQRVAASCGMLRSTDLPVIDIALSCGFSDQSYFNRIFRSIKGVSPSRYRRYGGAE